MWSLLRSKRNNVSPHLASISMLKVVNLNSWSLLGYRGSNAFSSTLIILRLRYRHLVAGLFVFEGFFSAQSNFSSNLIWFIIYFILLFTKHGAWWWILTCKNLDIFADGFTCCYKIKNKSGVKYLGNKIHLSYIIDSTKLKRKESPKNQVNLEKKINISIEMWSTLFKYWLIETAWLCLALKGKQGFLYNIIHGLGTAPKPKRNKNKTNQRQKAHREKCESLTSSAPSAGSHRGLHGGYAGQEPTQQLRASRLPSDVI